jgi:hypothetical protein
VERNCEPMNKNRIEGAAEQGERAKSREALVVKAKRRSSGGCAGKECVLTWEHGSRGKNRKTQGAACLRKRSRGRTCNAHGNA